MKTADQQELGALICITFLGISIWLSDWVPFRSEISTYDVLCVSDKSRAECSIRDQRAGPKVTYRPDRDTKTVVYWSDGQPPEKYDNCAIANAQNWSCPDHYYAHQMVDGIFDGRTEQIGFPHQVSKLRWWWLKFLRIGE